MSPKKRKHIDPLEASIESALSPGYFISYSESGSLVDDVQEVATNIKKIIQKEPKRAARLFETFIAACHEKAEEVDDSGGYLGMLVDDLFRGWIKARQAAGADRDDTAKLLMAWMEDDPYGFYYHLDREAVKVLDKQGLDALVRGVRSKLESTLVQDEKNEPYPAHARRRWGDVLKTLVAARRNIDDYIALCEQTGLGVEEYKVIAQMYRSRRRYKDAFSWVERGLQIARSDSSGSCRDYELRDLKRALLAKLGQSQDALESAWSEFRAHPSTFTYKELMRYAPVKEKKAWHEKAMEASEQGDLRSQIELWQEKNENARLVSRLRRATDEELEDLSHYWTGPVAGKLERSHPDIAARVYRALCMRVVNAGKSKHYHAALDHIERAKKCYAKAGLEEDWSGIVADVRARHCRKKGFMAGFEKIVSGAPRRDTPTFLERARARWPGRSRGK